jgi:hypothetical protein
MDRQRLPCWTCTQPEAIECQYFLRNATDGDLERQCSPGGLPINCCRIGLAGAVPQQGMPTPPRSVRAARRW